jgi:hypothetical protein
MSDFESFLTKVEGYHKAIEQEYEVSLAEGDPTEVRKVIDKKIAAALPGFVDQLVLIATMGDTDNAKLNAIKFAFNWYFNDSTSTEDPFTKMLTDLTSNTQEVQEAQVIKEEESE